jgi:hypothetical protein
MKKYVYSKSYNSLDDLEQLVREAWESITLEVGRKCILSVERKARLATIENKEWIIFE